MTRAIPAGSRYADSDESYDPEHAPSDEPGAIDGVGFALPGGRSALRAETSGNRRTLPCPTCKRPDLLTPLDRKRGYQCDSCADSLEGFGP
jgi:hypothetical protein